MTTNEQHLNQRLKTEVLDVIDIQRILKIGRRQAYDLVNSGQFHTVRIGKRIKISKKIFTEWLNGTNKVETD